MIMPRFAKFFLCWGILNCVAHKGLVTAADIDPLSQFVASIHSYFNSFLLPNGISDMTSRIGLGIVQIERRTQWSPRRSLGHSTLSSGTGFVVDSDGLIITNIEVVADEEFVNVTLSDGRRFRGQVVATNRSHDIAAVRINATNLPVVVELGRSEELLVDQQLVAIGSSSAQTHAIKECMVRFPRRPARNFGILAAEKQDVDYIETTTAISRSFLGGPLVNLNGQVVGMNAMVPGFPHRGVAIPVTYVRDFVRRLHHYRTFNSFVNTRRWRWIGALMYSLTPEVVEQFRQRSPNFPLLSSGIYVQSVLPDTPAQMSGLLTDDIITHINGLPVRSEMDVMSILHHNHMLLTLTIIRSGDVVYIPVVAEDWLH